MGRLHRPVRRTPHAAITGQCAPRKTGTRHVPHRPPPFATRSTAAAAMEWAMGGPKSQTPGGGALEPLVGDGIGTGPDASHGGWSATCTVSAHGGGCPAGEGG